MEETYESTSVDPQPQTDKEGSDNLHLTKEASDSEEELSGDKPTSPFEVAVKSEEIEIGHQEQENFTVQDVTVEYRSISKELELTPPVQEEEVQEEEEIISDISNTVEEVPTPKEDALVDDVEISAISDQSKPQESLESEDMESTSSRPSAMVKFRWSKVLDTTAKDIGFFPSYAKNDPILLSWDDSALAYFSPELKVDCGNFDGNIVVDGKLIPVEGFSIRTYTFEVDLFIKEDVLEGETPAHASDLQELHSDQKLPAKDSDSFKDAKITSPTLSLTDLGGMDKSRNLDDSPGVKRLINEETEVTPVTKYESSIVRSKRHSPVGDDAVKSFTENGRDNDIRSECSLSQMSNLSGKGQHIVEDVVSVSPTRSLSHGSVGSPSLSNVDANQVSRSSRPPSAGSASSPRSQQGSVKDITATSDVGVYGRPHSRSSDRFSPARSGRPPSRDVPATDDIRASVSPSNSLNRTPPPRTQTPVGSDLPSTRSTPQRDMDNYPVRDRSHENGDLSPGSALMEGRPPSHPTSRHSSQHSSRAHSLASLSSEQELGQYLPNGSRSGSVDKLEASNIGARLEDFKHESSYLRDGDRPTSVPSYSAQFQPKTDSRSKTPDNRIRVPASSDLTTFRDSLAAERQERLSQDRTSVLSNHSSRASSRTITPVAMEREASSVEVKELEANITNLRKLLTNRESEVHKLTDQLKDMRDINRSLHEELEHRTKRPISASREEEALELKRLLSEKEIMSSEIVTLREEIIRMKNEGGRSSVSSGISDYSPNSPAVLQRKITDLEAHIRDLQEVNESATMQLNKAEEKIKYLQEENRSLRNRGLTSSDMQADNDQLLRVEMRTLKEDIRNLKDRNFQLTEENMRLLEMSKTRDSINTERLNSSFKSDDGVLRQSSKWEREGRSSLTNAGDNRAGSGSQYRHSREEFAPKELRHSLTMNRSFDSESRVKDVGSSRLLHQRDLIKPPHLSNSHRKDISSSVTHNDTSRSKAIHADRSRPDGEVSEKLQAHRFIDSSSYDKKLHELARDSSGFSYGERPTSREYRVQESTSSSSRKFAPESLVRDSLTSERSDYRPYSSSGAISSSEIFFNLKQKRANRWVEQDSLPDKYISGNLQGNKSRSQSYLDTINTDDAADDSDTATDILLAQDSNPRGSARPRRNSLESDGSISSLSDVEDNNDNIYIRRRSKSVDARRVQDSIGSRQLSTLQRSGSATRPLTSMDSTRGSSGHRSVLPTPLVTQHNKGNIVNTTSLLNSSLTQGLRPFAPRGPADIRNEDVVKFSRLGGKLSQGVVKYVGHLPGRSDTYLGIELDKDEGKHDGTFEDIRYFRCKANKGVFVAFNKIVMAWAP